MRNQLIKELKETSYWNLVFKEDTIIAYFGGSELIGFRDNISDYDIICITKTPPKQNEYNEYLVWNKKKVHFVYRDINELFNGSLTGLGLMTLTQLQALKENNTIFLNNDNEKLQSLLDNADNFLKIGFEKLIIQHKNLINRIVENNVINERDKTKYLYHIVYAKRKYLKEPIQEEYLRQLKRIRWQPVEEQYITECINDLKAIKALYL